MPRGRPSRAAIHARLEEQVGELRARYGGLPSPEEAEGIWTDIWYQEAHHSTAIEGNTLVRRQVELLLKEGRLSGDKELREYLEVQGYAEAAKWVYGQALAPGDWSSGALVSLPEVRHIHELMSAPLGRSRPIHSRRFRRDQVSGGVTISSRSEVGWSLRRGPRSRRS